MRLIPSPASLRAYPRFDARRLPPTHRDAWSFYYESDEWVRLSDGTAQTDPSPRSSHTCTLVQSTGEAGSLTGTMLVFGGSAKSRSTDVASVVADVWALTLTQDGRSRVSGVWSHVLPAGVTPNPRFDHAAVAYNNGCAPARTKRP